jgi:hypothetical protein
MTPSAENRADAGATMQHRDALAGWAAFRALRQRPAPARPRRHGNLRHGRCAKGSSEDRRWLRLWMRWQRGGAADEPVPGLLRPAV